jgi:hypothetical protein
MNFDIANIIKGLIENENYIDKIVGLVRSFIKKENGATKIYPVGCELTDDECEQMLFNLIPDKKYRTLIYFEDLGTVMTERDGHGCTHWRSSLKLICWINTNKFVFTGCSIAPLIIQNIVSLIPTGFFNYGNYLEVKIKITGEDIKSNLIFSKYTYPEATIQYLHYPYDYFALNIQVEYKMNRNCITQIEIKDNVC